MKPGRSAFFWLLAVAALVVVACGASNKTLTPYADERIQLTDADRDALAAATRKCLESGLVDDSGFSKTLTTPYDKDVFVTLFSPGTESLQARGREKNIAASLKLACMILRENPTYPTRFGKKLDQTRIAVSIIDEVKELAQRDPKRITHIVEPGIHGLIAVAEGKVAYQLGEECIYKGWGMKGFGDRDRVMGPEMSALQLQKLMTEGGIHNVRWDDKAKVKLYYFTEHSFVESAPGRTFVTYRATKLYPKEITRSQLFEAAWLAARHIAMHTDAKGHLGYHYRPVVDKFAPGYNIVRHAGAVWGLFVGYKATGDQTLLEAGQRALAYLEPNIIPAEDNPKLAILQEGNASYLGSNALTAMALIEIPQNLLTPAWKEKRDKLGNSVIAFQASNGLFYETYAQLQKGGPPPVPQPRYYPGEAFLALISLYNMDGQKKWLDAAKKCGETQMREWDKNPKEQPDAWVVQAMVKLYDVTKDKRLPEYVFKMAAWHFDHEWGMPEKKDKMPYEDYYGGADNSTPPRSTPTSARNEANIEAWHLAKTVNDAEMLKKLGDSCLAAYWDNMIDQFLPDTSYFLPKPEKALGGIRGALISDDIRIDYDQHFLTSALNGLDLAEERNGVGELSPLAKGKILDVVKLGIKPEDVEKQLAAGK